MVDSDSGACLLVVEEAGIYQCVLKLGNVTEVSNPISIISVTEATGISAPEPEAQLPNRDHPEQDQMPICLCPHIPYIPKSFVYVNITWFGHMTEYIQSTA